MTTKHRFYPKICHLKTFLYFNFNLIDTSALYKHILLLKLDGFNLVPYCSEYWYLFWLAHKFRFGSPGRTGCSGRAAPAGCRRASASTSTPNSGQLLTSSSDPRSIWDLRSFCDLFGYIYQDLTSNMILFCRFDHHLRNDPLPEILRVPLEQMVLRIKVRLLLLLLNLFLVSLLLFLLCLL